MKILYAGKLDRFEILRRLLTAGAEFEFAHCEDYTQAVADLRRHGSCPDWIIMDGEAVSGLQRMLAETVRTVGSLSPETGGCQTSASGPSTCCVEWTADGVLELRCGIQSSLRQSLQTRPGALLGGDVLFSYHAPVASVTTVKSENSAKPQKKEVVRG